MKKIKVRAQLLGAHVHATFWTGREWDMTFALIGQLVMSARDWYAIYEILSSSHGVAIDEGAECTRAREKA